MLDFEMFRQAIRGYDHALFAELLEILELEPDLSLGIIIATRLECLLAENRNIPDNMISRIKKEVQQRQHRERYEERARESMNEM